jgi:Rhodopsin-like GPCR transmembrane domain
VLLAQIMVYTLLLLAIFLCGLELKTRQLYHCTYRLYTLSAMLYWSGTLLNSVTWAKYAVAGIGPFTIFGGFFTGASEIAFLLLMLLMAKGYTITRARLSTASTVKITVFINLYIVVHISLYIYQSEVRHACISK